MALLINYLKSTILSKIVMAITGLILVLYIIVHTAGNLLIYLGQDAINTYSQFLHSLGALLWVFRIGLLLALIFHIITSVYLKLYNLSAKPQKYAVKNYLKAKLTSRTMIWTGIMIFAFVVYHVMHLTMNVTNPENFRTEHYTPHNITAGITFARTDVFHMVILGFQNPIISIVYVIAVVIVGFHLNHAIQSMFQTLGMNEKHYFPAITAGSTILSTLIVICLISIPISVLLGLVGGQL